MKEILFGLLGLAVIIFIGLVIFDPLKVNNKSNSIPPERVFTANELAQYDGREGKKAYIAIDGIVYDVTKKSGWSQGSHHSVQAGADISEAFHGSPHKSSLLKKLEMVGTYKKE